MNWKCEKGQELPLRAARTEEEYRLHQAALEWSLADSIVIQSDLDIQSRARWRDRLKPYHHQVQNLFTFCRRLPVTLLADDVGLGKTISAGLILSELMARKRVSRALVVCPKILCPQWVEELDEKFGIQGRFALGDQLDKGLAGGAAVVVTTYESASARLDDIEPGSFEMLVLDEAHKLRNLHGGKKQPRMAKSIHSALQKRLFKFVLMLTATPMHNSFSDLYSLIDCLTAAKGHRNPFGTLEDFKRRYLLDGKGLRLNPSNAEAFRRTLREYLARTRRGDARLQFPTREVRLLRVTQSPQEQELTRLVGCHLRGLNPLQQTSLARALMSSPAALAVQLANMAQGQPSLRAAAATARRLADACSEPAKFQRLLALCNELRASRPDWRIVVFTHRKETQDAIGRTLACRGIPTGFIRGGEDRENQQAIQRFRTSPPGVHILVSTDAGAEGVNLQVANVLVNYDLPWNPMVVEQRIGRLQRLASGHANVIVCNLVAAGSVEERVVVRLMGKLQAIATAIGDIESILESSRWDGNELRFEKEVRDLVIKSLLGEDVERAARLAEVSIEEARRLLERQRDEMDETLGRLDELHHTGPSMPKLDRAAPSLPAREFVVRATQAEGGTVEETTPGLFEVRVPGRPPEVIAFEEAAVAECSRRGFFLGKVKLYQPGRPEFERLVQNWVERCGHHVYDLRRRTEADAERVARSWCEKIPGASFLGCQVTGRAAKFQGRTRVRVKASNGVDSYEKLISGKFHPEGHQTVEPTANPSDLLTREARPSEILPEHLPQLEEAVGADREVAEFYRFYEARRTEELARAGDDPHLRHKISEDFTPSVVADIVGFQGVRYEEVRLLVRFSVQGAGSYEAALTAVPASGQLLEEPDRAHCGHTGLSVPVVCLEACQVTGKLVLEHLLVTSDASGRRALPGRVVTCQVTGKKVFDDEVDESAVSRTVALKSLFVKCQHTGCLLLPSERDRSAYSGKEVRRDLLSPSAKSGRLGLADEFGVCEVTGNRFLLDEVEHSAVSNRLVDRELLHPSDRSGRLALAEELVTCQESGARLLPDETGMCVLTGKLVGAWLLAKSEVSGAWAIASLLERCAVTGKLALPNELEECAVTRKRALPSQMVVCQQTGARILASQAGKSDYSGKEVRTDLLSSSKKSGRLGLADEFDVCEVTGNRLLLDEVEHSAVSNRLVDRELLHPSDRSGRLALAEELVTCQESGARLLPDETCRCAATGQTVDSLLLSRSDVSGEAGLTRLMERCAVTCKLALPDEMGTCSATGKRVLRSRLVVCAKTGRSVLDTETGQSAVSGLIVWKNLLSPSAIPPHRLGLDEELVECQASGRRLLVDETDVSVVSGKRVGRDLLVRSGRSGVVALPEELMTCEESGARFLPAETGRCSVTKKVVDTRLLSTSQHSGRVALKRLMRKCAVTKKLVLPDELESCAVTGKQVLPDELRTCAVTGKRGIRDQMLRSDVSGRYVIPQKANRSAVSGKVGLLEELVQCGWLERPVLRDEARGCILTCRKVASSLLNDKGELAVLRDLLDGRASNAEEADQLIPRILRLDESFFRGLKHVWVVRSPEGGKWAVCGEIRRWLGMKVRYAGFLLKAGETPRIVGQAVVGSRRNDGWKLEKKQKFPSSS
jgi:superfamily II DNA or RNA helicase